VQQREYLWLQRLHTLLIQLQNSMELSRVLQNNHLLELESRLKVQMALALK
jgi:hypothetical protein